MKLVQDKKDLIIFRRWSFWEEW